MMLLCASLLCATADASEPDDDVAARCRRLLSRLPQHMAEDEHPQWRELQCAEAMLRGGGGGRSTPLVDAASMNGYSHRVIRYKYQDDKDMEVARDMLEKCRAFLEREGGARL